MKKRQRREYYIYREIQFKYTRLTLLLMILVCIIMGYTIYQTSWGILAKKLAMVYPVEGVKEIYSFFNSTLILRLLIIIPVIIVATIYLSHRVAGPVFHIERELKGISQGDFTRRIVLRKNDDLKKLANEINQLIILTEDLLFTLKINISEIEDSLREAKTERVNEEKIEKWLGALEGISQKLNQFKTRT